MPLTEEQKKRTEENRKRALELQRRRKLEQGLTVEEPRKEESASGSEERESKRAKKVAGKEGKEQDAEEDIDLEDFEIGASDFVTKREAKLMYCLPEGTLAVCAVVEKDNPHNKAWAKMKMYNRSEVRRRARKRLGGKQGLIAERKKREEERFRNDMEKTKNLFKKK